ncbi:hypothetical protein CBM2586_B80105 [Cupriavidus phytorum]|uniref:Uncharacterized protein n=1 Tax=Cupriavidus taiwanensis TaxID=164546 RepID=A0A375CMV1_9BURK|nr:hypothetical protein CBM2586_B80105 [Cupriavidus taiwanensis]
MPSADRCACPRWTPVGWTPRHCRAAMRSGRGSAGFEAGLRLSQEPPPYDSRGERARGLAPRCRLPERRRVGGQAVAYRRHGLCRDSGPLPNPLPQAGEGVHKRSFESIEAINVAVGLLPSPACGRGAGGEGRRFHSAPAFALAPDFSRR